jgi:hypothetical protein
MGYTALGRLLQSAEEGVVLATAKDDITTHVPTYLPTYFRWYHILHWA